MIYLHSFFANSCLFRKKKIHGFLSPKTFRQNAQKYLKSLDREGKYGKMKMENFSGGENNDRNSANSVDFYTHEKG